MQPPSNSPRTSRRCGARVLALVAISLLWQACNGEDITTPPTNGAIRVITSTSGAEPDPDGYSVTLDTLGGVPIGLAGSVILTAEPGEHTVELTGVAPNCGVGSGLRQTVQVAAGDTAAVAFDVTCSATAGGLRVIVSTTGDLPDDAYLLRVDQGDPQLITANGDVTLGALAPGDHLLELSDIAQNCSLAGPNPRSGTVTAGELAEVRFEITCGATVTQWTTMASQTRADLPDVWGSSGTDVFVVGEEDTETEIASVIMHYDGTSWSRQLRRSGLVLRAVWGSSSTDVFAVGEDPDFLSATVLHFDGLQWTQVRGFTPGNFEALGLESIWGSSASDIYAVGFVFDGFFDQSLIFHFDGTSWNRVQVPGQLKPSLEDVWGSSPTDVYAVGQMDEDPPSRGVVLHFDGSTWTPVLQRPNFAPTSVWGSSATDVYVAGFQVEEEDDGNFRVFGTIFHFDGTSWSRVTLPGGVGVLHEIWGSSSSDVFSVGDDGIIVHFDGNTWAKTKPTAKTLLGVWGSSSADVFAVGETGTILHGTP